MHSSTSSILFLLLSLALLLSTAQAYPSYGGFGYGEARSDFNLPVVRRSPSHSAMRNCFFSPVQCMMPMQAAHFNGFHKRLN